MLAGALMLAPLLCAAGVLKKAELTSSGQDSAQFVIELSTATRHNVFSLDGPNRVVIDLDSTRMGSGVRLPRATGPITAVRSGKQDGGTLRLVLESRTGLAAKVDASGSRLTVTLGNAPAAAGPPVAVRAAHAPGDLGRDIIVAIDAGHGGHDPGATGRGGTREKDVVLAIARALAKRVDAEPGMRAFLTRDSDKKIELQDRSALARRARADIFISIHADAIENRSVSGSSIYVLNEKGASSNEARLLADRENAADLNGAALGETGDLLRSVLADLAQDASKGVSVEAAGRVIAQLDKVGTVRKSKVQEANFKVLRHLSDIPSILVETAYISNPAEEKKLRSAQHQQALAEAIFHGVRDYFRQSPPDGTLFARQRNERNGTPAIIAGSTGK